LQVERQQEHDQKLPWRKHFCNRRFVSPSLDWISQSPVSPPLTLPYELILYTVSKTNWFELMDAQKHKVFYSWGEITEKSTFKLRLNILLTSRTNQMGQLISYVELWNNYKKSWPIETSFERPYFFYTPRIFVIKL
jgi:hypothetical protein